MKIFKKLFQSRDPAILQGIVIAVPCSSTLKIGNRVTTIRGLGTVIKISVQDKYTKKEKEDHSVLIQFLGKRGYQEEWIKRKLIYQYFVKTKTETYPLSYDSYNYILEHNQTVEFTLSSTKFAKLTDNTKKKYAHFVFFNKILNGRILYSQLKKVALIMPRQR